MGLIARLKLGKIGVWFRAPPGLEAQRDDDDFAMLVDREGGVAWHLCLTEFQLDLAAQHAPVLARDIERHTRDLFLRFFHAAGPRSEQPRTADPAWSPVVDVEQVVLGQAAALRVVHRLAYEPGRETLMGHLLVPLRHGLFEVRITAPTLRATGTRESALLDALLRASPGEDPRAVMRRLSQRAIDDPRHDADFPEHPLSRVRAALRRAIDEPLVGVTEPPAPPSEPRGEGFAVTPPARYLPLTGAGSALRCSRVSFSGTDGIQLLTVVRQPRGGFERADLMDLARKAAEQLPADASRLEVEVRALPDRAGRPHVEATRQFETPQDGPQRSVYRLFLDDRNALVIVALGAPACVPAAELAAEAEGVVGSYRA